MAPSDSFIIHGLAGAKTLRGSVSISGAKNAALKAMAAAILFAEPVTLTNIPDTADVKTLSVILSKLGVKVSQARAVSGKGLTLVIDPSSLITTDIDPELAGSMRASVVLTGPMLARYGKVSFPAPGGCVIGARPIDLFIDGYKKLGASVLEDDFMYQISAPRGLSVTDITFRLVSVGATETLMMAAVLSQGTTILRNCALEPEIVNVAEWLNACGADIRGVGTSTITVVGTGGKLLSPKVPYVTIPDRIEAGSFLVLGALCAEELAITDCRPDHMGAAIELLRRSGVPIEVVEDAIYIRSNTQPNSSFKAFDVTTKEYPGFPTDLQSPMVTYLTQVAGASAIAEKIFEGRFKYADDLIMMGADIQMTGTSNIVVNGPTALRAPAPEASLAARDIRAGFAIILAALVAEGTTTVGNIRLVDRGYERLEERLRALGAQIERVRE